MRNTLRSHRIILTAAGVALLTAACGSTGRTASPGAGSGTAVGPAAGVGTAGGTGRPAASPSGAAAPSPHSSMSAAVSSSASDSVDYPVDLQPSTAAPGSRVMVYGLSCSASTGTATSDAFTGTVALSMISNATGGSATVKPALPAGRYTVTVTCGDVSATGALTVS